MGSLTTLVLIKSRGELLMEFLGYRPSRLVVARGLPKLNNLCSGWKRADRL